MIESIIHSIGSRDFGRALFGVFCREMQVRQVMLCQIENGVDFRTVVAEDDRDDRCVDTLVGRYLGGYYRYDPLQAMFLPTAEQTVQIQSLAVCADAQTEYAQRLFIEPGISGKLCFVVRRPRDVICLSLYRDRSRGVFTEADLETMNRLKQMLAPILERHLSLLPDDTRLSLPKLAEICRELGPKELSRREADVCARVLTGYSNEAIALDLDLSIHSVATYRRRAYAKLGLTSQNELFSLMLARLVAVPGGGVPVPH